MHAENKLKMYKEIETVCTPIHAEWNSTPGFGSAFSKFASKVAQLDLVTTESSVEASSIPLCISNLIREIDALLNESLDRLVSFLQPGNDEFHHRYACARIIADHGN